MNNVELLDDVYKSYVILRNKMNSGEDITQSLHDLESSIYKKEDCLNQQIKMLKTELDRVSGL